MILKNSKTKFLIFIQFASNLGLSCRKFYEDSKNNPIFYLRPLLFELETKNF